MRRVFLINPIIKPFFDEVFYIGTCELNDPSISTRITFILAYLSPTLLPLSFMSPPYFLHTSPCRSLLQKQFVKE
jgi:hypothetical protein